MASAPRPGAGDRAADIDAAKRVLRLTINPSDSDPDRWAGSVSVAVGNLDFRTRQVVRKATGGFPIETYFGDESKLGEDSLQILLWLGRRANGEPMLTLNKTLETWPVDFSQDDFELVLVTPDEDDSPEA